MVKMSAATSAASTGSSCTTSKKTASMSKSRNMNMSRSSCSSARCIRHIVIGQLLLAIAFLMMTMVVETSYASDTSTSTYLRNGEASEAEADGHDITITGSSRNLQTAAQPQPSFSCNQDQDHLQSLSSLQTLEDLQQVLVMGAGEQQQPHMPLVLDATDAFHGATPYIHNGFYIRPIYFEGLPYEGSCTLVFAWLGTPVEPDQLEEHAHYASHDASHVSSHIPNTLTPGTVLLHGGGGTADKRWVEEWANAGFSSISMSLEGQTTHEWSKTPFPGPFRGGVFREWRLPLNRQWMFHAVATSMLGNTILRAQPFVNENQVGVAGCSWGGILTTVLLPLEQTRYVFASVGYGTASLADHGTEKLIGKTLTMKNNKQLEGEKVKSDFYKEVWDATPLLHTIKTPTLWMLSPTDYHFALKAQTDTYQAMHPDAPVWVANVFDLRHHTRDLYKRPEHYAFAKSVIWSLEAQQAGKHSESSSVRGTTQRHPRGVKVNLLASVSPMEHHDATNGSMMFNNNNTTTFSVVFRVFKPLFKASLIWTSDTASLGPLDNVQQRDWKEEVLVLDVNNANMNNNDQHEADAAVHNNGQGGFYIRMKKGACQESVHMMMDMVELLTPCFWTVTVVLHPSTKSWYINGHMEHDLVVSSPYRDVPVVNRDNMPSASAQDVGGASH